MRLVKRLLATMLVGTCSMALAAENGHDDFLEFFVDKDILVESTTRSPKPLSQIAENVTVITSVEIREMNAHSVSEVLQRIPGLFIDFAGQDFGSIAQQYIQGSKEYHVLVLLDEMPWNFIGGGNAETNGIPIEIIDRIEVIKGPASSSWGSALGGVINIITKKPRKAVPSASIQASLGPKKTRDVRTDTSGTAGALDYYLYAGYQHTDGLKNEREFANPTSFAKFSGAPTGGLTLTGSVGFSRPEGFSGDLKEAGIIARADQKIIFANIAADFSINDSISAHALVYASRHVFRSSNDEDGQFGPAGDLYRDLKFDENKRGVNARLVWSANRHTVVSGIDYSWGSIDQSSSYGVYLQSMGAPVEAITKPTFERWGAYLNDTISLGALSVIPGIRFDDHSVSGTFWSPSLGATYRATHSTLVRFEVARGFTSPGLSESSGGGLFIDPNPDLKPETVWSYQLGVESNAFNLIWLKGTLFRHDLEDAIVVAPSTVTPGNGMSVNDGYIKRTGFELEFETVPHRRLNLYGGGSYVFVRPSGQSINKDQYTVDLGLKYVGEWAQGELHGHKIDWDLPDDGFRGKYGDVIWDLNLSRTLELAGTRGVSIFGTVHNLFNGKQYASIVYPNPGRWFELGGRFNF